MEILIGKLALIGLLGLGAQWLAWRWQLPAIVLLLLAGFIAGPVTGVLDPAADFGALLTPLVAVAVAVILFEGGLTLNVAQIRETSVAVRRLVSWGAAIAFMSTSLAAHYVAELSWPSALVLAGILVVTGPTVVMPLLRHARLGVRPASMLRWEAILADPLGALIAVLVFEAVLVMNHAAEAERVLAQVGAALSWAVFGGYGLGRLVVFAFVRGHVPEYLKAPLLLSAVIATYAISNFILEESGLLTVTVLGIVIGNARIASLAELRRFKEIMTVMLVSSVFIVLTASLSFADLAALDSRAIAFIACLLFLIRPLSVMVSTIGSGVPWRDRVLVAWIAPRGVVAIAVAGLFGAGLTTQGVADGAMVMPLTFAVVLVTVVAHGFTIRPLASWLGIGGSGAQGVLVVGASKWSVAFAESLADLDVPVMIADRSWHRLRLARSVNLPVFWGDILSEVAEHQIAFSQFGYLLAATDNDDYNALVCTNFGPELGRGNVFEISRGDDPRSRHGRMVTLGGRPFLAEQGDYDALNELLEGGWSFRKTKLTEDFDGERFGERFGASAAPGACIVAVRRGQRLVFVGRTEFELEVGDVVVSFAPGNAGRSQTKEAADQR